MKTELLTLTPHWGDRARDAYWSNPTKYQALGLFALGAIIVACGVALA